LGYTAWFIIAPLTIAEIGNMALTPVKAEVSELISRFMNKQSSLANVVMLTMANSGYVSGDASFTHNSFRVGGRPVCRFSRGFYE